MISSSSIAPNRKNNIAKGTLELHERTGRYLIAFFGEKRRLDTIQRTEARTFKTVLGSLDFEEKILKKWILGGCRLGNGVSRRQPAQRNRRC